MTKNQQLNDEMIEEIKKLYYDKGYNDGYEAARRVILNRLDRGKIQIQ